MAQATLSVRIDRADKEHFEHFCKSAGLNISTAVNLFVKSVVKNQQIPFPITGDPFYSEANQTHLLRSIEDAETGKLTPHDLIEDNL